MKSHVTISIRRRLFVRIPTSRHFLSYLHNFSSVSLTFSKLTYIARKEDARLKTSILLGDDDLILKMKLKNETEWEREKDLNCFGEIAEMDMTIKWPSVDVKQISLPPKGRVRKNVHNLSQSGSESGRSEAKRSRIQEENLQKVQDFVKKLQARKPKLRGLK